MWPCGIRQGGFRLDAGIRNPKASTELSALNLQFCKGIFFKKNVRNRLPRFFLSTALDRPQPLPDHGHDGTGRHVLHEGGDERVAPQVGVVVLQLRGGDPWKQAGSDQLEAPGGIPNDTGKKVLQFKLRAAAVAPPRP